MSVCLKDGFGEQGRYVLKGLKKMIEWEEERRMDMIDEKKEGMKGSYSRRSLM